MLPTKREREAAVRRLLGQRAESGAESLAQESGMESKWAGRGAQSREEDYDIPAEVILSKTARARERQRLRASGPQPR